jgi:hypothetical protein
MFSLRCIPVSLRGQDRGPRRRRGRIARQGEYNSGAAGRRHAEARGAERLLDVDPSHGRLAAGEHLPEHG